MLKQISRLLHIIVCSTLFLSCSSSQNLNHMGFIPKSAYNSVWDRMQSDFMIPSNYSAIPAVSAYIKWYAKHPEHVHKILDNSALYMQFVLEKVEERGLPGELALLPFIESNFDPFAYSSAGASGMWQIMPSTASGYGVSINWWYDGRRDVIMSTKTSLDYLTYLNNFFDHNWLHAIAAYDSGEGTVRGAVRKQMRKKVADFWSLDLPIETKSYVPKLLALKEIIVNAEAYGIKLPDIPNSSSFIVFTLPNQVDLAKVANSVNMEMMDLRRLNPAYRRGFTAPDTKAQILIPIDKAEEFKKHLSYLSKGSLWQQYVVKAGDSLSVIAFNFKTTVDNIKKINKLQHDNLKIKQILLLPVNNYKAINGESDSYIDSYVNNSMITEDNLPGPKQLRHKILPGDTVTKIAKKHNVKIGEIEFWNNVHSSSSLTPGNEIIIWHPPKLKKRVTYKVKAGDSLGVIAKKFNTSVAKIKQQNNLPSSIIKVGQTIKV
jgi:membrane-bound lytic murein transglycosylase D